MENGGGSRSKPREPADQTDTEMSVALYLERIGVDPDTVKDPDRRTLERLQRAHVTTVPFETLTITGDPFGEWEGDGVHLSVPHLYEKIVERERGGYCFELNGLFYWLLAELGYDAERIAARVVSDGAIRTPANHHPLIVEFDLSYVVDVGMGPPMMRRPVPVEGGASTDEAGVDWRVVESERPDAAFRTEYRSPAAEGWTPRYVFNDVPRSLSYFEAANEYLQTAPESPFTGEPIVAISTGDGYRMLSGETLIESTHHDQQEKTVTGAAWHETLQRTFGLTYEWG